MILRPLKDTAGGGGSASPRPAWPAFQEVQEAAAPPLLAISQPLHAELSGVLASALSPELFGPLPQDVMEAIRTHDEGWREADDAQVRGLSQGAKPQSFVDVTPAVSVPAWRRSIRQAEAISLAAGVLVSRHFCALAKDGEPEHAAFLAEERAQHAAAEEALAGEAERLKSWLAALGFCDLLSLVLCSGMGQRVTLPVAYPRAKEATTAEKITVWLEGAQVCAEPAILMRTGEFSATVPCYAPGAPQRTSTFTVRWG